MAEGEIDNLSMEQYLALTRGNQAPGVVKPKIGGNVNFEIKGQFMRELREDTFSENKNDEAHEHVERVLDITAKQLKEIRNFKQEGDETLYQTLARYNDLLYKCPTHDINIHQKWHDGSSSRKIESSSNSEGIAAIVSKLDNLGRDMKKLKENVHAIQFGCQNCKGTHLDKDCPLNEEVKSVKEAKYGEFGYSSPFKAKLGGAYEQTPGGIKAKKSRDGRIGTSVNVIPKSMFEHLKLAQFKKIAMLVEMADMTKRSPIGIVENVFDNIDKFLFLSNFVVMDMLNTRNETVILGRPFLAIIHVEIDVFNKEISLGIRGDRVTFDMNKKIHNFTTPIGKIYTINSIHNEESPSLGSTPSDKSSRFEKSDNNYDNHIQERRSKKTRMLKSNTNLPSTHFYNPVKQICNGILKVWPTCDPTLKACNGGIEVYGMNKEGNLKRWYCYLDDDRGSIKGGGLSFPEFLLVKYGEVQKKELIWDNRYAEWCNENSSPYTPTSKPTLVQEDYKHRPKDYSFKDWLLTKVGHTEVSEPI
ncbi:putative reverse transcriptase domain-containing protein [Tanacetum coccineum]